ncbi:MAG: hypothetical protein AB7H43_14525 [Acidimicrobiia bacterium]
MRTREEIDAEIRGILKLPADYSDHRVDCVALGYLASYVSGGHQHDAGRRLASLLIDRLAAPTSLEQRVEALEATLAPRGVQSGAWSSPGDPGYLPAAARDEAHCAAGWDGFECTRRDGHDGDHAAHGPKHEQVARW